MVASVPLAFDVDFYRGRYPDLAHMDAGDARDHFLKHGMAEGRQATALGCRAAFINHIQSSGSVLEIGPFNAPLIRGDNVRYLDMLDAAQLRLRAQQIGLDPEGCPEYIHYVGDIVEVDATFDTVVSSHAIEHQPDLVHHLQGVARVLRPTGRYCLFVPDKRYCFDHFIPESTIADVLQAHRDRPTVHTLRSVIEHHALNTHNDASLHWAGEHGELRPANQDDRLAEAVAFYDKSSGTYIDVHAWYFTPINFSHILSGLYAAGLSSLRPIEIYPTLANTLEFLAVLEQAGGA